MTLIKSISGIRGTIGGKPGEALTPLDVVRFTSAFGAMIQGRHAGKIKLVIGRDARLSGEMVAQLVNATLNGLGIDVVDLGLSTTPTVEMAVPYLGAQGGIILTASHNPKQWNALKLLNEKGEFISASEGELILQLAEKSEYSYAEVDDLGKTEQRVDLMDYHIQQIIKLPLVDKEKIAAADLKIVIDAVNSSGGIFVPALLEALGVKKVVKIHCEPNGHFPHNPEPLPEHLGDLSQKVVSENADMGITVDPDVDRSALVCEDGSMFGEEYTLVAVSDYVMSRTPGACVSNLSSTRALRDVAENHGQNYAASAVGEVNVVVKMKEIDAVIGGEGNGGIIYPELHYGRDSLVGIALFLTHFADKKMKMSELRDSYPKYVIAKNKIELSPEMNVDGVLELMANKYIDREVDRTDGVKILWGKEWVHLRKSNTEPIIRIYAESTDELSAKKLGERFVEEIQQSAGVRV